MRSVRYHPAIQCWGWPPAGTLSVAYLTMPSVNVFGALPGTKCTLLCKEIYPSSYTELRYFIMQLPSVDHTSPFLESYRISPPHLPLDRPSEMELFPPGSPLSDWFSKHPPLIDFHSVYYTDHLSWDSHLTVLGLLKLLSSELKRAPVTRRQKAV